MSWDNLGRNERKGKWIGGIAEMMEKECAD